ncbi:MAG: DNA-binding protein WhiA [Actinobacteria bacterium]|nr:DNA-binding protein WhiA [Actinomycetota bacterium]
MSLSEDLRNELAAIAPRRECDVFAELSGLAHTAGTVHLLGGRRVAVHFDVASSAVARRGFSLLRSFEIESEIRTYTQRAFSQATRYQLHVPGADRALQVLYEAGILAAKLAPLERPPARVVARSCCRGAYLRGALLGSGSLSGPRSPHLEVRFASLEGASFLAETVVREDVMLGVVDRRRHAAAYVKGADAIAGALALAGANDLALVFEERSVVSDTRSRANRLANADHANLVRTSRAAHEQISAVRALRRAGRLENLPAPLHEIAMLRLRHPSFSLRELALECGEPTSKAAAHRRLRKLVDLAQS